MHTKSMLAGLALCFALAGCATPPSDSHGRRNYWAIQQDQLRQFKPGVTTKAEVEKLLGAPHGAMQFAAMKEEAWTYGYMDRNTRMVADIHFDLAAGTYKYDSERVGGFRSLSPYN